MDCLNSLSILSVFPHTSQFLLLFKKWDFELHAWILHLFFILPYFIDLTLKVASIVLLTYLEISMIF
jgi:hypothetical protein